MNQRELSLFDFPVETLPARLGGSRLEKVSNAWIYLPKQGWVEPLHEAGNKYHRTLLLAVMRQNFYTIGTVPAYVFGAAWSVALHYSKMNNAFFPIREECERRVKRLPYSSEEAIYWLAWHIFYEKYWDKLFVSF